MKAYCNKLIPALSKWLYDYGLDVFFKRCLKDYKTISPVFRDRGIPHPVHFREGMSVRNFLRESKMCPGWDDNDYDENWSKLVLISINFGA